MFGLLYNLYKFCKKKSERKITLALLGLDNAGKTTLLNTIQGEIDQETAPTFGFKSSTLQEGKYTVEVFDLGGGKTFRSVWTKYLAEVHAIVYVVDAADAQRFEESKKAMTDTLECQFMRDKPILLFANKQDLPTASTAAEVVKGLGLTTCKNSHNVFPCTAKTPAGSSVDPRLREGLRWLVGCVDREYSRLDARVQADVEEFRQEDARRKKERDERIQRQREERQRLQKEEEERAREVEKENALHDGKSAVLLASAVPEAQPAESQAKGPPALGPLPAHLGLALGLPHTIESPSKPLAPMRPFEAPSQSPLAPDPAAASLPNGGTSVGVAESSGGGNSGAVLAAARGSGLPPLPPTTMTASVSLAARPATAQGRAGSGGGGGPDDAGGGGIGAAMASAAVARTGSRPGSAGRQSAGSSGGRSGCSSPRRQGTGEVHAEGILEGGEGSEGSPVGGGAGGGGPGPRGRSKLPGSTGGGSGVSACDLVHKGSFNMVHQNKVVPVGGSMVADVPS